MRYVQKYCLMLKNFICFQALSAVAVVVDRFTFVVNRFTLRHYFVVSTVASAAHHYGWLLRHRYNTSSKNTTLLRHIENCTSSDRYGF
jgi:hypothetical protein